MLADHVLGNRGRPGLYNLFLFLIVRHQTYLWYVLTVVCSGAVQLNFNGLLFQWFWPDVPWINRYFTVPVVSAALIAAIVFTMKFLLVKSYSRWGGYRVLQALLAVNLLGLIYGFLGSYQVGIIWISSLAAFATPPVAWLIGINVWRRGGQILGGFYVLAWTPLLLGGHLVLAVSKLGWIPRSPFTELAPPQAGGVAVEVILLSFALAYRINMERAPATGPGACPGHTAPGQPDPGIPGSGTHRGAGAGKRAVAGHQSDRWPDSRRQPAPV